MRGVARGGLANLAGTVFTGVAGLGTTWLVAHGLGASGAGAFFTATAVFAVACAVAKLGTQTSLVYWPARLRALGTPELAGRCLRIGLGPVAVAGALIGVALYHAGGLLAVLAPLLPAAALSDAVLAATRGYRSMRPTVVYDRIVRPALQLAGLATLAWLNAGAPCTTISLCKVPFQTPGLVAFACAWALPYAPTLALAALALHRLTAASPRSWTAEPAIGGPGVQDRERPELSVRAFWAFSAPRAVAGVAQLALNRVDVVLVAALAGLPAAALYTVAGRFVVLGQFVNQAISQAIQPRLAESLATADLPAAKRLYQQGTAWLVLATWPLYLLVGAYAPVYLALFGPHYAVGATITALLAAAMLVATGCGMVDMVLAMGGRTSWNLGNVALALAVTVGADLLLIPRYGALGAAFGLAAAVLANNLVPLAQIGYALRLHPFGHATLKAAGLAVACFGVPALLTRIAVGDRPAVLAAFGAAVTTAGALAYVATAYRLRRPLGLTSVRGNRDESRLRSDLPGR
jgi:O-antigen/teichoic acid export membrane protein